MTITANFPEISLPWSHGEGGESPPPPGNLGAPSQPRSSGATCSIPLEIGAEIVQFLPTPRISRGGGVKNSPPKTGRNTLGLCFDNLGLAGITTMRNSMHRNIIVKQMMEGLTSPKKGQTGESCNTKKLIKFLMSQRTRRETPRGRYDEHSSMFSLSMRPKFNQPVGERNHFRRLLLTGARRQLMARCRRQQQRGTCTQHNQNTLPQLTVKLSISLVC
jgi:hypothetical protein